MEWLRYMYENQRSDLASMVNCLTVAVSLVTIMLCLLGVFSK